MQNPARVMCVIHLPWHLTNYTYHRVQGDVEEQLGYDYQIINVFL